jgi:hypothetical protein
MNIAEEEERSLPKPFKKRLAAEQRTTRNTVTFTQIDTRDIGLLERSGLSQRESLRFVIYTYTRQVLLPKILDRESQNLHLCYDS